MHIILLLFLYFTPLLNAQNKLISYELVKTYSKKELQKKWKEQGIPEIIAPIHYNINVYEVIYNTTWHDGTIIKASGLYFVPNKESGTKTKPLPMICYHHGTQILIERKVRLKGEQAICIGFAADGYLVARPDYIGLGKGDKKHLYHHVQTQAAASIDMLRAIKEINPQIKVKQNDLLFTTGYSQGGHATMGFHKTVQEKYKDEFHITASAPMSGAYDLAGVQEKTMFKEYSHPGYLPYLFFSFHEVYHFYDHISEVFKTPYDTLLPDLYKGMYSMGYINRRIPNIPKDIIRPEVVKQYVNNNDFPFKKALRENSVHDWKPERPMLICYCKADEQVNYKNALVAHKKMRKNGSKNVRLQHVNKHLGHNDCAMFAVMHAKMFFDSFRKGSKRGNKGPLLKRFLIGLGKAKVAKKTKRKRKKQHQTLAQTFISNNVNLIN
ncbi:MAG: lipase family protein [Saprospiraceae bacterium]|nr:lipase family protein [Saprospiraceae bacterium]